MSPSASRTGPSHPGPSLAGLRRALAEDQNFARVRAEAARGFDARGQDYQISAPAGLRAALLAEMADGLAAAEAAEGTPDGAIPAWSSPSPPPAVKPRT